jgi:catechol 2,3-dioxygenase-like lactoylglutathione lyase family enzyme
MPSAAADPVRSVALVMLWESIGSVDAPVFTGINHICVVTHDLDRSVRTWFDRYGVGPWRIWTKDASNMSAIVDGEPTDFAMRVALCQLSAGFRLEIIEPLDQRSPYARSLAERGGADHIHHVRFEVSDHDDAERRLRGLGLPVLLEAEFAAAPGNDARFAARYFGTERDLGLVVETGGAPAGFAMPEPEEVYPPEDG